MGKAARIACILTPMLLTIASSICLILIELSGWNASMLPDYYFFQANFTNLTTSSAGDLQNTTTLTAALQLAQEQNRIADAYQIHLWNYCTEDSDTGNRNCTGRSSRFYFDPISVWGLNATTETSSDTPQVGEGGNVINDQIEEIQGNTEELENELLGDAGRRAMDAYRRVSRWMFIAYAVSFWTSLATIVLGFLAIFSRWGSLLTWIAALVSLSHPRQAHPTHKHQTNQSSSQASSLFTFAAVLTSTILFSTLLGALRGLLDPYNVNLSLGRNAFITIWLSVAFTWAATLFWLFSVCCCSGRSNPHHKNNKGGLWNAEPKGQGYGFPGRGRSLRVEKTGGGYERVGSPFVGGDQVPLQQYPGPAGGHGHHAAQFEPYRS